MVVFNEAATKSKISLAARSLLSLVLTCSFWRVESVFNTATSSESMTKLYSESVSSFSNLLSNLLFLAGRICI